MGSWQPFTFISIIFSISVTHFHSNSHPRTNSARRQTFPCTCSTPLPLSFVTARALSFPAATAAPPVPNEAMQYVCFAPLIGPRVAWLSFLAPRPSPPSLVKGRHYQVLCHVSRGRFAHSLAQRPLLIVRIRETGAGPSRSLRVERRETE